MLPEYTTRLDNRKFFILPVGWIYTFCSTIRINGDNFINSKIGLYDKDTINLSVNQDLNSLKKFSLHCLFSASYLPDFHRGARFRSQAIPVEVRGENNFLQVFGFPLSESFYPITKLSTNFLRRAWGRSLDTFRRSNIILHIRKRWRERNFHIVF
jgi:hypothetical protein